MKTDYLRIVQFWNTNAPNEKKKGIFHKWITKEDKTIALIEDFNTGKVVFIETQNMHFLNYFETKSFWDNLESIPNF